MPALFIEKGYNFYIIQIFCLTDTVRRAKYFIKYFIISDAHVNLLQDAAPTHLLF